MPHTPEHVEGEGYFHAPAVGSPLEWTQTETMVLFQGVYSASRAWYPAVGLALGYKHLLILTDAGRSR